jgi:type II secretory pathway pseudopilin PulG
MVSGLLNQKGMTMLETTAAMVVIVLILTMIIPNNVQRIQIARFQKTVVEMKAITDASIDYYVSQGNCPPGIEQLSPVYLQQATYSSPFLSNYLLSCTGIMVSVSNLIPGGLAQKNPEGPLLEVTSAGSQDIIKITKLIPHSWIGRLEYDKKYLYGGS